MTTADQLREFINRTWPGDKLVERSFPWLVLRAFDEMEAIIRDVNEALSGGEIPPERLAEGVSKLESQYAKTTAELRIANADLRNAVAELTRLENEEAAHCPEDVGWVEYVKTMQATIARLEDRLLESYRKNIKEEHEHSAAMSRMQAEIEELRASPPQIKEPNENATPNLQLARFHPGDRVFWTGAPDDTATVIMDGKHLSVKWDSDDQIDRITMSGRLWDDDATRLSLVPPTPEKAPK
ncbi:MAG: hypothetical protein WC911_02170 [Thermoleophilia bacterium]